MFFHPLRPPFVCFSTQPKYVNLAFFIHRRAVSLAALLLRTDSNAACQKANEENNQLYGFGDKRESLR